MNRTLGIVTFVGILSFSLVGCSGSTRARAKLSGKVTLDGIPVTIGTVTVFAEDGLGEPGEGHIDTEGNYSVPNAPVGKVKIRILKPALTSDTTAAVGPGIVKNVKEEEGTGKINQDMNKAEKTVRTASGGKKLPTLPGRVETEADRQDQAKRYKTIDKMPGHYSDPMQSGLTATVAVEGSSHDLALATKAKK